MKFFKEIVYHLEIVNEYMKVLRAKGSSLTIKISIKTSIQENIPSAKYYYDGKQKEFEEIRDFLLKAKNNYIAQLNKFYKEKLNIRFLYGKQFRSIMKYLESGYNIDSFLRYILNQKGNKSIKEGYKAISRNYGELYSTFIFFYIIIGSGISKSPRVRTSGSLQDVLDNPYRHRIYHLINLIIKIKLFLYIEIMLNK